MCSVLPFGFGIGEYDEPTYAFSSGTFSVYFSGYEVEIGYGHGEASEGWCAQAGSRAPRARASDIHGKRQLVRQACAGCLS